MVPVFACSARCRWRRSQAATARVASMRLDRALVSECDRRRWTLPRKRREAGAPEGLVIVADEQTAGRGRRGRDVELAAGRRACICRSFFVRHSKAMRGRLLSLMTLAAGVAARDGDRARAGLSPDLKWPNDLMCRPAQARRHPRRRPRSRTRRPGGGGRRRRQHPVGRTSRRHRRARDVDSRPSSVGRVDRASRARRIAGRQYRGSTTRLRRGDADDILRAWRAGGAVSERAQSSNGTRPTASGRARRRASIDDWRAAGCAPRPAAERIVGGRAPLDLASLDAV